MRLHRRHETDTPRGAVTTGVPLSNAGGQRGLGWAGGLPQRGAVLAFVRRRRVGAALPRRRHRPRRVRRARPGGADRRRRRAAGAGSGAVGTCRGRPDDATGSARPVGRLTRRRIFGVRIARLAASADGGGGYWNPHPDDDPMEMVIGELIPRCQRMGLGRGDRRIGTLGISMGGYGAILLAERYPQIFRAAAAISPAIWTSYEQARSVNPGAYASAAAFAAADAVTHASSLKGIAIRVATGLDDAFGPGVEALARALPRSAVVRISRGCHSGPFFDSQLPPSLAFLARHLTAGQHGRATSMNP